MQAQGSPRKAFRLGVELVNSAEHPCVLATRLGGTGSRVEVCGVEGTIAMRHKFQFKPGEVKRLSAD